MNESLSKSAGGGGNSCLQHAVLPLSVCLSMTVPSLPYRLPFVCGLLLRGKMELGPEVEFTTMTSKQAIDLCFSNTDNYSVIVFAICFI